MLLSQRNFKDRLARLFRRARRDVLISSPFVQSAGVDMAINNLAPQFRARGRLCFLTDLSPRNICQAATDPSALLMLCECVRDSTVRHLPSLHAKVYLADSELTIVTSANLTAGGLFRNYEYGIEVSERSVVSRIRSDIEEYGALGARVGAHELAAYCSLAEELRTLFRNSVNSVSKKIARRFEQRLREAEDELVGLQLCGGPVHTVFEKTVLYVLRRHGPLTTNELHPIIAAIHPDLCDDDVDRVINGVHFGKKWKHAVRTAQQQLKRKELVKFHGKLWTAV